ncbi:MAG: biotin synthase BioB [Planctomycetes bacterium HGW-Planctomycetes-1]|nr:MAG: biotin synthase BioB [Planctomycetes bacterium HGW-Planctomycetes-1]
MNDKVAQIAQEILDGKIIDRAEIKYLFSLGDEDFDDLLYWANRIREKFFGKKVKVCSIVPGRLGGCSQDCKFCAQSSRYETSFKKTETLSDEEILRAAKKAKEKGVPNFGIVYSGKTISEEELARLEKLIAKIKNEIGIGVCGGFGIISYEQAARLKKAGMSRYNHNLETSRNHFKDIVTTHDYDSRIETVKAAKKAGLGLCTGGLFGIGEEDCDRIDMAMELRELDVDMVPMNFLHPIAGTPLGELPTMQPRQILQLLALYRFILPKVHIKAAGGRALNLRDMQSWIFYAGATAIISGDYLTTAGRAVEDDLRMIKDLGLEADVVCG